MIKNVLIMLNFVPLLIVAQENKKCKDKNRGIDQLPCTITSRYGTDVVADEDAAIKYTDILINKRELLNPEKAKPYQISSIAENKVWHIVVTNYNCRYCKIYININKNTGEILNFYRSED